MAKLACDRIIHFRSQEKDPQTGEPLSKEHPKRKDYFSVNVCSNSRAWKTLSPMFLGPIRWLERRCPLFDYPNGILPGCKVVNEELQLVEAQIFENIWQTQKIYNIDRDEKGYVKKSFFERRAKFFQETKGHRRTIPKSRGYPVAAYFDGRLMSYLESRAIYCHLYEKLVTQVKEFKKLKRLYQEGHNLLILGFDGQKMDVTPEKLDAAYADPKKPFGHELVICCLLLDYRPWFGEIITYAWLDRIEDFDSIPMGLTNLSGTTRVRIQRKGGQIVQDCDVYIGRRWSLGGWDLPASPFANPFRKADYPDQDVVDKYRDYLLSKPKLLAKLPELRGKVLGCFCSPTESCHGDVLIELLDQLAELEK